MSFTPTPDQSRSRSDIHFTMATGAPPRPAVDHVFCDWLFAHSTDSILISDASGHILSVNGSLCSFTGYTASELISRNISEFLDKDFLGTHPLRYDLLSLRKTVLLNRN